MKKIILVCVLFLGTLLFAVEPVKKSSSFNNYKEITVVDNLTNEVLVGVNVNNDYSDLDGKIFVNLNEKLKISYISYSDSCIIVNDTLKLVQVRW